MKNYLLIFAVLYSTFGQKTNIKTIKVEYVETVSYTKNIINNSKAELIFDVKSSFYNSTYTNSTKTNIKTKDDELKIYDNSSDFNLDYQVVQNSTKDELKYHFFEHKYLKKQYITTENLPIFKWNISKNEKTIQKYKCKQATAKFRGRTYVAWFTTDIPCKYGPWKFNGLPGLILSVEDSKGIYKWHVKKIETINSKVPVEFQNINKISKNNFLTYEEFDKKYIYALKEKISLFNSRSARDIKYKFKLDLSTEEDREPINEFRNQMNFD